MTKNKTTDHQKERSELHKAIWKIANDLRGSVDGWDFKQYVLGILFYRFISENITIYINTGERKSNPKFDFAGISDKDAKTGRDEIIKEKGFFILPSELFSNVTSRAPGDSNLNETLEQIFSNIESSAIGTHSESDFKGLFNDIDVNSAKLGETVEIRNKKLVRILQAIDNLEFGKYADNSIDAFGDAYEFLMTMYASGAGKSGGEFFTPQEVSELLARIIIEDKKEIKKVYDPAAGSGSLLLQFAKVLGKENIRQGFYGQEINLTTYNLCRINMILHDINFDQFDIAHGDTLTAPKHLDDGPFDAIVSNPPYSIKWEGKDDQTLIDDARFSAAGVLAPKSKADLAFTMHMLSSLSTDGTAAIVQFLGTLYRGGTEKEIRKYLIENNYVDTVILLPSDLFFGTSIATCILVLKKSKNDNKVLFIDASKEFIKSGKKNQLEESNRQKILEAYTNRTDIEYYASVIDSKRLLENDCNLSVSSYVEEKDTSEKVDITKLNQEIKEIVAQQQTLRREIDTIVAELEHSNHQ